MRITRLCLVYFLLSASIIVLAQDPTRFEKEVTTITASDTAVSKKNLILFTGSSSIRFWGNIKAYYPEYNVVNRGFGGSMMSDLIYYFDKLVVPYEAKKIFIYEGDNDLGHGKTPQQIIADADSVLKLIRSKVSKKVPVYFITPKPSIARWHLKDQYIAYNQQLKEWASRQKKVTYVDVWTPLLDSTGQPQKDIFIEDGLHLNKKGYEIWSAAIKPYVK